MNRSSHRRFGTRLEGGAGAYAVANHVPATGDANRAHTVVARMDVVADWIRQQTA